MKNIEKTFQKELNRLESWAFLRIVYNTALGEKSYGKQETKRSKWKNFKSVFYGMSHWFSRYENIIFSSTMERRNINEVLYDKSSDKIIDILGERHCLTIENPVPIHAERKYIYTKNIVSIKLLNLCVKTMFSVFKRFHKINRVKVLDVLNTSYNLMVPYQEIIQQFRVSYFVYTMLFKLYKPKRIFISCYYFNQAIVKAANDLKIDTYELQHGSIAKENMNYNTYVTLDKSYFPRYIFVYDSYSKKSISPAIYAEDNIFIMGNYYLEYLLSNMKEDDDLKMLLRNYTLSIGVSLQWTCENQMIEFINKVASKNRDKLFLLLPRELKAEHTTIKLEYNVLFYDKLDCHTAILHCDYHMSVYSTCIVEASQMDIPNILFNFNNYAKKYYEYLLDKRNILVDTTEDFNRITFQKRPIQSKKNKPIQYEINIREFFDIIEEESNS